MYTHATVFPITQVVAPPLPPWWRTLLMCPTTQMTTAKVRGHKGTSKKHDV